MKSNVTVLGIMIEVIADCFGVTVHPVVEPDVHDRGGTNLPTRDMRRHECSKLTREKTQ